MADNNLTTKSSSGTQDAAGNNLTQPATSTFNGGTPTDSVQPVVGSNALNNTNGVALQNRALPTIDLSAIQASSGLAQPAQQPRDINPALFGISGLLLVIAIAMFWSTSARSGSARDTSSATVASDPTPTKSRQKSSVTKSRKKRNVKKKK